MPSGLEIFIIVLIILLVIGGIALTIYLVWRNDQNKKGPTGGPTGPNGNGPSGPSGPSGDCKTPIPNLRSVTGVGQGNGIVFRFVFDNLNLSSPPLAYKCEMSSDNFSTISEASVVNTDVGCNPVGCAFAVEGVRFSPVVVSTNYSARIRLVQDAKCGPGNPSNIVAVSTV